MAQRNFFLLIAGVLAAGCSSLADESSGPPPLARISGTLTLADGVTIPDEQIRMTLLWETLESINSSDQGGDGTTDCWPSPRFPDLSPQEVPLDATFPNAFSLDLTVPPPEEALFSAEEGGPNITASARIVVYADGDEDGELDSRAPGMSSPDRILATSEPERWGEGDPPLQYEVHYYTEAFTHVVGASSQSFPAGFSLQRFDLEGGEILPIDTEIELRLTNAPYLQDLLCEELCDLRGTLVCPESPADLPEPAEGAVEFIAGNAAAYGWSEGGDHHSTVYQGCSPGAYVWNRISCEGCTCVRDRCFYEIASVAAQDWPCVQ